MVVAALIRNRSPVFIRMIWKWYQAVGMSGPPLYKLAWT
jgi:hypothetical protein